MVEQLLDDLRAYFSAKERPTPEEQMLMQRLSQKIFPILMLEADDLVRTGFDVRRITDEQKERLAISIAQDYCQSETSAGENFWEELEEMADRLCLPRNPVCPVCGHHRTLFDAEANAFRCEVCDQTWHENLYILVEFPKDTSHFENNGIGYPSFNSEDNGARYILEYEYLKHFGEEPEPNSYFKPLCWPESQLYLFPDKPNESIDALNEPISDEKGLADFGEQAVWVPLYKIRR